MHAVQNAEGKVQSITLLRPSNFHAHFRRGAMMQAVTPEIMRHMRYVLAMPNTGPIVTLEDATTYHKELAEIARTFSRPIDIVMTLYLTELITPQVLEQLMRQDITFGIKYYPPEQGATTGSGRGIPLDRADAALRAMEELGIPLLGHFESVLDQDGRELPHEKREGYMVQNVLWKFRDRYPTLRHTVEHASTREAVDYVKADTRGNTAMTVTPQHSLFVGDDLDHFGTELKCMPIVKTPEDRAAIVEFITSGDFRAIAGDDAAPHPHKRKSLPFGEAASGCWLPHSLELYASVFDHAGALDYRFERFMSTNGPVWWDLKSPDANDTITLVRKDTMVPSPVPIPGEDDVVVPLGWMPDGKGMHLDFRVA